MTCAATGCALCWSNHSACWRWLTPGLGIQRNSQLREIFSARPARSSLPSYSPCYFYSTTAHPLLPTFECSTYSNEGLEMQAHIYMLWGSGPAKVRTRKCSSISSYWAAKQSRIFATQQAASSNENTSSTMAATVDGLHPTPPPTVAPFSNQVHRTKSACVKVVDGRLTSPGAGAGLDGVSPFLASPSQLEYLSRPPSLDAATQLWADGSNKIFQKLMSARD